MRHKKNKKSNHKFNKKNLKNNNNKAKIKNKKNKVKNKSNLLMKALPIQKRLNLILIHIMVVQPINILGVKVVMMWL